MRSVTLVGDLEAIVDQAASFPDVILVKKKYKRGKRIWKLKHLEKETVTTTKVNKKEEENNANQYEEFLKDIEEDKPLRSQLNLYRDDKAISELESKFKNMNVEEIQKNENDPEIDIKVEDLLDEMTLDDTKITNQHTVVPLIDMKYDTKGRGTTGRYQKDNLKPPKVVTINKNKPSKDLKNQNTSEKPDKVKRTRTGNEVEEGSEDEK